MNFKLLTNPKCACDHKSCCDEAAKMSSTSQMKMRTVPAKVTGMLTINSQTHGNTFFLGTYVICSNNEALAVAEGISDLENGRSISLKDYAHARFGSSRKR